MEATWESVETETERWEKIAIGLVSSILETENGLIRVFDQWMRNCPCSSFHSETGEMLTPSDIIIKKLITLFLLILTEPIQLSVIVESHDIGQKDLRRRLSSANNQKLAAVNHGEKLRLFESLPWTDIPTALLTEEELDSMKQILHSTYEGRSLFHLIETPLPTSDICLYRKFVFNYAIQEKVLTDRPIIVAWYTYKLLYFVGTYYPGRYFGFKRLLINALSGLSEDYVELKSIVSQLTIKAVRGYELKPVQVFNSCENPCCQNDIRLWKLEKNPIPFSSPSSPFSVPNSPPSLHTGQQHDTEPSILLQELMQYV